MRSLANLINIKMVPIQRELITPKLDVPILSKILKLKWIASGVVDRYLSIPIGYQEIENPNDFFRIYSLTETDKMVYNFEVTQYLNDGQQE